MTKKEKWIKASKEARQRVAAIVEITKTAATVYDYKPAENRASFVGELAQRAAAYATDEQRSELLDWLKAQAQAHRRQMAENEAVIVEVQRWMMLYLDIEDDDLVAMAAAAFPHQNNRSRKEAVRQAILEFKRDKDECRICGYALSLSSADTHFLHEPDCGIDLGGCDCHIPVHDLCCPECNKNPNIALKRK